MVLPVSCMPLGGFVSSSVMAADTWCLLVRQGAEVGVFFGTLVIAVLGSTCKEDQDALQYFYIPRGDSHRPRF